VNRVRVLYHLVRADFLERTRRYSFLLTLAFAALLAYGTYNGTVGLRVGDFQGELNSAWIGAMMALVSSVFLSLAGFYIVKNTIERDEVTRVGRVLATTPMTKVFYTLAKALSNFAVLAAMVAVLSLAAVALAIGHGGVGLLEPGKLLLPFLWITLPAMALTASLAVLFETLPVLRSGLGNVIYFFVWTGLLIVTGNFSAGHAGMKWLDDFAGFNVLMTSMRPAVTALDPTYTGSFSLTIGGLVGAHKEFLWSGIDWTANVLMRRLLWILIAGGAALLAAVFFHRFDPARESARRKGKTRKESQAQGPSLQVQHQWATLSPLRDKRTGGSGRLLFSELVLMLKGQRWWWYIVALGLVAACAAVPDPKARAMCLAAAWIWPVLLWSQMGSREAKFQTGSLVFSTARVLGRQLPAAWAAGVVVALLTGSGMALRLILSADWAGVAGWTVGAFFIPTFALALGAWSGTSKTFEAVYTIWWYVGPMNQVPGIDFTGMARTSTSMGIYLLLTAGLLACAFAGRRRQLG
jgi:hypothetical protein